LGEGANYGLLMVAFFYENSIGEKKSDQDGFDGTHSLGV
jgi:hypothetical protein